MKISKKEVGRMKLTHAFDYSHVVGEIFLNREIIDAVLRETRFELVASIRLDEDGMRELVGLSLMPIAAEPDVLSNAPATKTDIPAKIDPKDSTTWRCKRCDAGYNSSGWWKCCPQHTNQHFPEDVVCSLCAFEMHPEYKH